MTKICFLNPYFGKWPRWFNYYLKSCAYNPSIEWLFFTDCPIPDDAPDNVKFTYFSLKDFNHLASQKLGLKIALSESYKICDLRPAFGIIFEDYIRNFDFWGYGDIDLIYGDIKSQIQENTLNRYDVISAGAHNMVGHFSLFRNTPLINNMYKRGNYKAIFSDSKFYNYDESNFVFDGVAFNKNRAIHFIRKSWNAIRRQLSNREPNYFLPKTKSISHIVMELNKKRRVRLFAKFLFETDVGKCKLNYLGEFKGHILDSWSYYWNQGKLKNYNTNKEILYFHFQFYKHKDCFQIHEASPVPNRFSITPKGII